MREYLFTNSSVSFIASVQRITVPESSRQSLSGILSLMTAGSVLRLNKSIECECADKTSSADYAVNAIAVALGVAIPENPQLGLSEIWSLRSEGLN